MKYVLEGNKEGQSITELAYGSPGKIREDLERATQAGWGLITVKSPDEDRRVFGEAAAHSIARGVPVKLETPEAKTIMREQLARLRREPDVSKVPEAEVEQLLNAGREEDAVAFGPRKELDQQIDEQEREQEVRQERPNEQTQEPEVKKPEVAKDAEPERSTAEVFPRKSPPEVLLENTKGRALVRDHGDRLTVTNRAMYGYTPGQRNTRDAALATALEAAAKRFGEPVRLDGSERFVGRIAEIAAEKGIQLEPGNERVADALEKKQRALEVGRLSQSRQAERTRASAELARQTREQKAPDKGMEIG